MRFVLGHAVRRKGVTRLWVPDEMGCWIWQLALTAKGYGLKWNGAGQRPRTIKAHRWVYEQLVGPIPDGLILDHICFNRACVNPAHLEPITQAENLRRGRARTRRAVEYLESDEFVTTVGPREAARVRAQIAGR